MNKFDAESEERTKQIEHFRDELKAKFKDQNGIYMNHLHDELEENSKQMEDLRFQLYAESREKFSIFKYSEDEA